MCASEENWHTLSVKLSIANRSSTRSGASRALPAPTLELWLAWSYTGLLCVVRATTGSHVQWAYDGQKNPLLKEPSATSGSYTFCDEPWATGVWQRYHLWLNTPQSHSLLFSAMWPVERLCLSQLLQKQIMLFANRTSLSSHLDTLKSWLQLNWACPPSSVSQWISLVLWKCYFISAGSERIWLQICLNDWLPSTETHAFRFCWVSYRKQLAPIHAI